MTTEFILLGKIKITSNKCQFLCHIEFNFNFFPSYFHISQNPNIHFSTMKVAIANIIIEKFMPKTFLLIAIF